MPKLSVIIPMYNSSSFIKTCLDSIKGYPDLEVLLLDDGSSDNTVEVVRNYIKKNKGCETFQVISLPHQGLSLTRRYGMEKASSDYIAFLDSDDEMVPKNYLKLLDSMKKHNCLVGMGRIKNQIKSVAFPSVNIKRGNKVIELSKEPYELCSLITLFTCKIWHKDILKYYDSDTKANEDIECVPFLLAKANRIYHTDDVIYHRVIRGDSLASTFVCDVTNPKVIRNTVYPTLALKKRFQDAGLYDFYKDEVDAICMKQFFERIFNINFNKSIKNKDEVIDVVMELLNIVVPDFLENPHYLSRFSNMEINDRLFCRSASRKAYLKESKEEIDGLLQKYSDVLELK